MLLCPALEYLPLSDSRGKRQSAFYHTDNFFVTLQAIDYPYKSHNSPDRHDIAPPILFYDGHIISIGRRGFFNHSDDWSEVEVVGDDPIMDQLILCDGPLGPVFEILGFDSGSGRLHPKISPDRADSTGNF